MHLRTRAVKVAHNGRHAGFVAHGCREVDGLFGVVLGERLDLASMTGCPLTGQEGQRAMARRFELSVRHLGVWLLSTSMFEITGFGACCGRYSLKADGRANASLASALGLSIRDGETMTMGKMCKFLVLTAPSTAYLCYTVIRYHLAVVSSHQTLSADHPKFYGLHKKYGLVRSVFAISHSLPFHLFVL